ncbi:NADH:flavin oxidoreductase [Henriciella aquimarina]|uniref:NADH:flavin oxidoreductase n=1 Tax=Henriciella aquimarina TaxID=545261 RepID=UPI000A06CBE8|nr:NADH:flavin oxidoreductase [Henriciella aquimarina]
MSSVAPLFEPFRLKGLDLPNRIVMAPMTRGFSPNGVPTDKVRDYYARRAGADVGLILSEGTLIRRKGAADNPNFPLFHTEPALEGWKNVIDAVHAEGGKMGPQIWHQGMVRKAGTGHYPDAPTDSPSGTTHKGKQIFEAPSEEEVADMVAAYADAAASAKDLGFDTVEIHGAHGYLIDQFFWDVMNKREDKYGGGLVERAKFAGEIISEVKKAVGPDIPVILRFSQWKQQDYAVKLAQTPQELEAFLKVFVDAGVDILHASQRRFWEPEFPEVDGEKGLNAAGWTKKLTGLPTITVGSVGLSGEFIGGMRGEDSKTRPLTDVIERLDKGEFDLVAVGRALLQDPFWAQKIKEGRTDELTGYDAKSMATLY